MILLVCDAIHETESFSLSQVCLLHLQKVARKKFREGGRAQKLVTFS